MRYYWYHGNGEEPKTKFGMFFKYTLFPSFIFSFIISALIEGGIKLFGGNADLTQIWIMVFVIVFLILAVLNIKTISLIILFNFILFLFITGTVFSILNLNSNKLNFVCGVIVAFIVCFTLAIYKDKNAGA